MERMRPGLARIHATGSEPASRQVPTSNCSITDDFVLFASRSMGRCPGAPVNSDWWLWYPALRPEGSRVSAAEFRVSATAFQPSAPDFGSDQANTTYLLPRIRFRSRARLMF